MLSAEAQSVLERVIERCSNRRPAVIRSVTTIIASNAGMKPVNWGAGGLAANGAVSFSMPEISDDYIEDLIRSLDSLMGGESAASKLISCGPRAIPFLERFLLSGAPRTIALPRRRAVRVLSALGARSILTAYLQYSPLPEDAVVLFAEDGVRSDAARELMQWKTEEVFQALLQAAHRRATSGIIFALGEFRRSEAIPLFFGALEDDLCREDAKEALRRMPGACRAYALLLLRGETVLPIHGSAALRRRRATLQLLEELGIDSVAWQTVRGFLAEDDLDAVLATAGIGLRVAPRGERAEILLTLLRVSRRANWAQEGEMMALFDREGTVANSLARTFAEQRLADDQRPDWRDPSWRILGHILGPELEKARREGGR